MEVLLFKDKEYKENYNISKKNWGPLYIKNRFKSDYGKFQGLI
jgi:hypothetical protein